VFEVQVRVDTWRAGRPSDIADQVWMIESNSSVDNRYQSAFGGD